MLAGPDVESSGLWTAERMPIQAKNERYTCVYLNTLVVIFNWSFSQPSGQVDVLKPCETPRMGLFKSSVSHVVSDCWSMSSSQQDFHAVVAWLSTINPS